MPGFIDFLGRRDRMPGSHRQPEEALVFAGHPAGEPAVPALIARQPRGEGEGHPGLIDFEGLQSQQQFVFHAVASEQVARAPSP